MQATLPYHFLSTTTPFSSYYQSSSEKSKKKQKTSREKLRPFKLHQNHTIIAPAFSRIIRPKEAIRSLRPQVSILLPPPSRRAPPATAPKFSMRVASKQTYICHDCGYIYNGMTLFEKQPDNYFCPVCGAPKWRFRPYEPKVTKNANDTDVRKTRKTQHLTKSAKLRVENNSSIDKNKESLHTILTIHSNLILNSIAQHAHRFYSNFSL